MTCERVSPEHLRERLNYDPITGVFTWRTRVHGHGRGIVGKVAGTLHRSSGYIIIRIGSGPGRGYPAHVVAWAYVTGSWPELMVDHKNMVKTDNRWENLRLASAGQNKANSKTYRNNTSGFRGVSKDRYGKKWTAQIKQGGKHRWLGTYDTPEEAHAVYKEWALKLHGEFARF